jgi:hypothetical protein
MSWRGVVPVSRIRAFVLAFAAVVVLPLGTAANGVSGPAFYVDGVLYRTVGTPTDLSGTGAPAHSFDILALPHFR